MAARFVLLAYAITWSLQLPFLLARAGHRVPAALALPSLALAALGPALAAILLTPRAQRRQLFDLRLRGNAVWLLIALAIAPAAAWLAHLLLHPHAPISPMVTGPLIGIAVLSPPGEELGWRGYLLPRLDPERRPLRASVIVGVVWCAWHIPYDGVPPAWLWIFLVAFSIVVTRLWLASGRSTGVAIAAHLGIHLARLAGLSP